MRRLARDTAAPYPRGAARSVRGADEPLDARLLDRAAQVPRARSTCGSQLRSCLARVMSGWRTWGSSTGSASKTISDRDSVASITASASSSRVISFGLPRLTGRCTSDSASSIEPADQVVDVAEAPRLAAVAEHGHRLVLERLAQEGRDRPAVVRPHPGPEGVEDPRDAGVDALLAVVGHRQRLGVALRLVVDAAGADRVDVPPVVLRLRMDLRVAVDLRGRGEQEPGPLLLRQARACGGSRRSRP